MQEELIITKPYIQYEKRFLNSLYPTFDLESLVKTIKENFTWKDEKLNAISLLKSREKSLILFAIKQDTEIQASQLDNSIVIQVLDGKIELYLKREIIQIPKGQALTFYKKTKYKLIAQEEAVVLLTINRNNY